MAIVNGVVVRDTNDPLHNPSTYKVADRVKMNRDAAPIATKYKYAGTVDGVDVYENEQLTDPIEQISTHVLGLSQGQEQDVYMSEAEIRTIS